MALVLKDRVKETTSTAGTGTLTLAGAETGFQTFSVIGNGNTTYYALISGSAWEVGLGTYTLSGTTLSRDIVLESSNSGNKISLTGVSTVFCTYPAEKSVFNNTNDQIVVNSSGVLFNDSTVQTTAAAVSGDNVSIFNNNSGYLTSHPSISAASSSDNAGRTYIQDLLLDSNGHVTGVSTATESGGGGTPGGSDTQVQFNSSGSFSGDPNFVWNTGTSTLTITGHIAATTKSFFIDHPYYENKKLQYASLEGPENGVYTRGRTTSDVIHLPYYWGGLVNEDSITVHLTPQSFPQPNVFVKKTEFNRVYLSSDKEIDVCYSIFAERKDVPPLRVEI